jgi:malate dehydrogenase (oxaloacetate-decarboxylating)
VPGDSLYPPLEQVREVARDVAVAVATEAHRAGLAEVGRSDDVAARVAARMWEPRYVPYRRV